MKDDKASNPVAISLLGPDAVVLDSVPVADAVAQQDRWNRPPIEQRLSAPELHTRAVILRDFQATSHRSFDRSPAAMNSEAPPLDAARSNHTSRWAAQEGRL